MSTCTPSRTFVRGFYVMDAFAATADSAYVSGPFDAATDADADRRERNIGADCETLYFDGVMFREPDRDELPIIGTAYHAPTDMFVNVHSTDSKSRTSITHPMIGQTTVPASELRDVALGTLRAF